MVVIDGNSMTVDDVYEIAVNGEKIELSSVAKKKVREERDRFEKLIDSDKTIYGVNTGFGSLLNVRIGRDMEKELQKNLIRSHSAGYGEFLDRTYVRAIMAVRANTLSKGYSAVTEDMLSMLMEMVNRDVIPAVPRFGSVGASGDLAPLAHIGLAMMGEGYAFYSGKKYPSSDALRLAGLKPYEFKEKEGVALINGTSMMAGILSILVKKSYDLIENAILSALLSFEGLNGTSKAFSSWIVESRPHHGQIYVAKKLMELTEGSDIVKKSNETKVQDAYTLRCIPQVYGAVIDTVNYVKNVVNVEINSATDNPLFNGEDVVSGGNFHGEPVALVSDFLAIALTDMGNMIERRIARLVDHNLSGLPPFLVENSGINSGYMIPQYTAAALCNRNKTLSYPSSADSIPTSANQEDHVSMGANSVIKLSEIVENLKGIISIEFLLGSQSLEFSSKKFSINTDRVYRKIREKVPPLTADRPSMDDISVIADMIEKGEIKDLIPGKWY